MVRFAKLRKDEFITRKGKIVRKPKDDRCNRGHLLYYDQDREIWDCPICMKMMEEEREIFRDMETCYECGQMRMEGLTPAVCQHHLDEQMRVYNKYNK